MIFDQRKYYRYKLFQYYSPPADLRVLHLADCVHRQMVGFSIILFLFFCVFFYMVAERNDMDDDYSKDYQM